MEHSLSQNQQMASITTVKGREAQVGGKKSGCMMAVRGHWGAYYLQEEAVPNAAVIQRNR